MLTDMIFREAGTTAARRPRHCGARYFDGGSPWSVYQTSDNRYTDYYGSFVSGSWADIRVTVHDTTGNGASEYGTIALQSGC